MKERPASMRESQRAPAYLRGRRLRRIGATTFWIALTLTILAYPLGKAMGYAALVVIAGLTACLFLGIALMRRGRKLMAASGEDMLAQDQRAPVVYLRPFTADAVGTSVATRFLGFRYFTEEEQLAMVMNEIGPFVAIGDPRESVADLGAARIYAREGDWQRKVSDLVSRARLIILRAGTSEGFWYELRAVHASVPPARVLLLAPADRTEYANFRKRAREVLPHPLPEQLDVGTRPLLGNVGAVIEFDDDWRPRALPVVRSFTRTIFTAPYVVRLKLTLKPVFERLDMRWSAPPVARARMALLIVSSVIGLLAFAVWLSLRMGDWFYEPPEDFGSYSDTYSGTYSDLPSASQSTPYAELPAASPSLSPYDQALATFATRSSELPEFAAALSNATSPQEARGIGRELSKRGLHRLSDERLLERAMVLNQVLAFADLQTCASLVKGTSAVGMESALRQLAADDVERFFDLTLEAMAAELRQQPGPPLPSEEEVGVALQVLTESLPGGEGERLLAVLNDPQQATDDDGCVAARSLYAGLIELPEPHRAVLARALIAPE